MPPPDAYHAGARDRDPPCRSKPPDTPPQVRHAACRASRASRAEARRQRARRKAVQSSTGVLRRWMTLRTALQRCPPNCVGASGTRRARPPRDGAPSQRWLQASRQALRRGCAARPRRRLHEPAASSATRRITSGCRRTGNRRRWIRRAAPLTGFGTLRLDQDRSSALDASRLDSARRSAHRVAARVHTGLRGPEKDAPVGCGIRLLACPFTASVGVAVCPGWTLAITRINHRL